MVRGECSYIAVGSQMGVEGGTGDGLDHGWHRLQVDFLALITCILSLDTWFWGTPFAVGHEL